MSRWNLWHGCERYSDGCKNCYVYAIDESRGRNESFIVRKTADFDLPLKKNRKGEFKLLPSGGAVYTCFTSDFFIEDADCWREKAWEMIKIRNDLHFLIPTKRIVSAEKRLPRDWGNGYDNVTIAVTMENSRAVKQRLEIFQSFPAKKRVIFAEPLLEEISFPSLDGISLVSVGGESGAFARECKWEWIEKLYRQCDRSNTEFHLHQLGANFTKSGKAYRLNREEQLSQAKKAEEKLKNP